MTAPLASRRAYADYVRETYPVGPCCFLRFGHCTVAVETNRETLRADLERYFKLFLVGGRPTPDIRISVHEAPGCHLPGHFTVKPPEPGKTSVKEAFCDVAAGRIVHKRLTDMYFVFGAGDHLAVGPCGDNLNQVVNFINNRYIEWILCQGCLLGHAAGVVLNGRGLAMAGFSGAGKSTLALHLMNKGATFVSNDRLMIERHKNGLVMHGVAKMPRINPGTALNNPHLRTVMSNAEQERFAALPEDELWELEHKYDAFIDECYGPDRFRLRAAMEGLVILNWQRGGGATRLAPVDLSQRRDLMPAFMKDVGLFFLPDDACAMPTPSPEGYVAFLARCRVLEISGGVDFAAAAEACRELTSTRPEVA